MPSFTTLFEDSSPVLLYSSNQWVAGTSSSDTKADQYSDSSFTVTQQQGATMKFNFYGSSVQVFGAKRNNHGNYGVQIDSNSSSGPLFNGVPNNGDQFGAVLFSTNVNLGWHNLTVTNAESKFFDVDYVTVQTSVGNDNEELIVNSFQDSHPSFVYNPPSSWTPPKNEGSFSGGSGHATTSPSAISAFNFEGDAVTLYGPVGPDSASAYSVVLDNGLPSIFSAQKQFTRSQQILYTAAGLGGGKHSLQIQLRGSGELAIDYANVYSAPSLGGSFLETTAASNSNRKLQNGAIAGIILLTLLAIFSTLFCVYLLWRQRQYQRDIKASMANNSPEAKIVQPFVLSPLAVPEGGENGSQGRFTSFAHRFGRPGRRGSHAGSSYFGSFTTPAQSVNPPSTIISVPRSDITSAENHDAANAQQEQYQEYQGTNRPTWALPTTEQRRLPDVPQINTNFKFVARYEGAYGGMELPTTTRSVHPPPQYMPRNSTEMN